MEFKNANAVPTLNRTFSFNYLNSEWDFGDGLTSTQQHPTHIYTSPDTYDVQLIVSNSSQCYSDTIIQTVLIDSLPQISFSNSLSLYSTFFPQCLQTLAFAFISSAQ